MKNSLFADYLKGGFSLLYKFGKEASQVKQDPEKAKKFKKFGIMGIILGLIGVALAWPVTLGCINLFRFAISTNLGIFTYLILIGNIFLIILSIVMGFYYIGLVLLVLILPIMQLVVNRGPIGWIALIVDLLCVAGTVMLMLSALNGIA